MVKANTPLIAVVAIAVSTLLGSQSATASDAPNKVKSAVTESVKQFDPDLVVTSVNKTPMKGVYEVTVGSSLLYFSADGRHFIAGDMIEMATKTNVTDSAKSVVRAKILAKSDRSSHIIFGDPNSDKRILVFTDTSCSYCQMFHKEVPKLNAAGITVEYLAYPRGGPRSAAFAPMMKAWCSPDRNAGYELAIAGKDPTDAAPCAAPLREHYTMAEELGVEGTPTIYTPDGRQIGGFLRAEDAIKAIQSK